MGMLLSIVLATLVHGPFAVCAEATVVFDFSKMGVLQGEHTLQYEVSFDGKHLYRYSPSGPVDDIADIAAMLYGNLKAAGVNCELKGKYQVIISSWKKDGRDHAVREGKVTSETIKPNGLPMVSNPPKA